jgi:hypothetical protein
MFPRLGEACRKDGGVLYESSMSAHNIAPVASCAQTNKLSVRDSIDVCLANSISMSDTHVLSIGECFNLA